MAEEWESKYLATPEDAAPVMAQPGPPEASEDAWKGVNLEPTAQPTHYGAVLPWTTYSDKSVRFEPLKSGLLSYYEKARDYASRVARGEASSDVRDPGVMGEVFNLSTLGLGTNPFVRSGDRAIPGVTGVKRDLSMARTPTVQELKNVGGKQISDVVDLPVQYNPQHLPVLADQIEQNLLKEGILPSDAPGIYETIHHLRQSTPPPGSTIHVEPANLISLRKNIAGKFGKESENQRGVGVAFEHLNNFIENPPAGAVLAGPAADVGALYAKGRANYAAGMRGEELADIRRTADLRAASANSGQNLDNSLRGRVATAVLDDARMRGFNPAEKAALEAVPVGTPVRNFLRNTGNLFGGGGGLGAGVTSGLAAGAANFLGGGPAVTGAAAVIAPGVGAYLKNQAAKGTVGALQAVEEATRRRSPLFLDQLPGQDLVPSTPGRDAIARALLQIQQRKQAEPPLEYDPNRV